MSAELKPCPFCGSDDVEISWYARATSPDPAGHYVECVSCSASGEGYDIEGEMPDRVEYTRSKAIAAWNDRPADTELADLRAKLDVAREALDYYAASHDWPNDGPWGVGSDDFGDVARTALATIDGALK